MQNNKVDLSLQKIALCAGIGYLIIFVTGIFANFFVIEGMVVAANANQTAQNIIENNYLFRMGILSFILMVIADLFLAWALYLIFIPVNKNLSLFSAWLRLVNTAVFGIALYNLFAVLGMLNGESFLSVFSTEQLYANVLLFLNAFNNIWLIGLIFFGIHLVVLAYLIYRSGYAPKFIAILLVIAGFGYLIDTFAHFLLTNYNDYKDVFSTIVILPGVVGELSFTFWLLFKGNKIPSINENQA